MMAKMLSVLFLSAYGQEFEDSAVLQVSQVNRHQTTTGGWYSNEQKMHYNFGTGYAYLNITASRTSETSEWSFKAVIDSFSAISDGKAQSNWRSSAWVCFNDELNGIDGVCTGQLKDLISGSSNTFLAALDEVDDDGVLDLSELAIGKEEQATSVVEPMRIKNKIKSMTCNGVGPVDVLSKTLMFEFNSGRKLNLAMMCNRKCKKNGISDVKCKFKSKLSGTQVWGLPDSTIGCHTKDQNVDADCTAALDAFIASGNNGKASTKSTSALGVEMVKYFEQIADGRIAVGTSAPQWSTLHDPNTYASESESCSTNCF